MKLVIVGTHQEKRKEPLLQALAKFEKALAQIGYKTRTSVDWSLAESKSSDAEPDRVAHLVTQEVPVEVTATPKIVGKGGGYYDIIQAGAVVGTVRGKPAAQAFAASL